MTALLSLVSTLTRTSVLTVVSLFLSLTAVKHSPTGFRSHAAREQLVGHTPNEKERSPFPEQRIILICTVPEPVRVFFVHPGRNPEHICGPALQFSSSTSLQAQFLHWNNEITLSSCSTVTKWVHSFSSFDFKLTAFCNQFRSIASNRISSSHCLSSCLQQTLAQKAALEKISPCWCFHTGCIIFQLQD